MFRYIIIYTYQTYYYDVINTRTKHTYYIEEYTHTTIESCQFKTTVLPRQLHASHALTTILPTTTTCQKQRAVLV